MRFYKIKLKAVTVLTVYCSVGFYRLLTNENIGICIGVGIDFFSAFVIDAKKRQSTLESVEVAKFIARKRQMTALCK